MLRVVERGPYEYLVKYGKAKDVDDLTFDELTKMQQMERREVKPKITKCHLLNLQNGYGMLWKLIMKDQGV